MQVFRFFANIAATSSEITDTIHSLGITEAAVSLINVFYRQMSPFLNPERWGPSFANSLIDRTVHARLTPDHFAAEAPSTTFSMMVYYLGVVADMFKRHYQDAHPSDAEMPEGQFDFADPFFADPSSQTPPMSAPPQPGFAPVQPGGPSLSLFQQTPGTLASLPQVYSQRTFDHLVQVAGMALPAVATQPAHVAADITTILDAVLSPLTPKQTVASLLSAESYLSALTSHLSRIHTYYKDLDRHPRSPTRSESIFPQSTLQTLQSLDTLLIRIPPLAAVCFFFPSPLHFITVYFSLVQHLTICAVLFDKQPH